MGRFGPATRALDRIRSLKMLDDKLSGMNNTQIAAKYGIHPNTVTNVFKRLSRDETIQDAQERVMTTLVPKSLLALERALNDPEDNKTAVKAAIEVLKGSNIFRRPRQAAEDDNDDDSSSLEVYVRGKLKNASSLPAPRIAALPRRTEVIDVEPEDPAQTETTLDEGLGDKHGSVEGSLQGNDDA